jgi:enoyl-CoA hydratase/carnithine racemase
MTERCMPKQRFNASTFKPRHFRWALAGGVATVTLDNPARKNPLTFDSYAELTAMFRALRGTRDVKAVIVTGAGSDFSSGGDVHDIIGPLTKMKPAGHLKFTRMTGNLVKAMRACPQPIIAAVDGVAAGAGAILAMAADLRLGTPRCKTAFLFTRVGLSGADMGACAILPRLIGHGRAAELLLTGRTMTAEEGVGCGFFNRLTPPERLMADAEEIARRLAAGPTRAHAVTKQMLHREWNMGIDAAIDLEARVQAKLMQTNDFRRAYEAFVAKKTPEFKGD